MHEVNDRLRDIGEFVPAPDDDMLICRCEEITKGEIRKAVHDGMWTMTEIRRYLRDNNSIRVSRSIRDLAYRVLSAKEKLTKQNEKEPTIEEIEKELNVPKEDIIISMDAMQEPISLQEPVYGDNTDNIYVMDQIGDKNDDSTWLEEIAVKEAITNLSDREKRILSMRFFRGKTQMEVAAEIGISQAQVSRIEKGALDTIKKNI